MRSGLSLQNSSLLGCASEHSRNAHDHGPLLRTALLSLHCLTASISAALTEEHGIYFVTRLAVSR